MDTPQTIAEEMLAQAERDGCATDWRLRDWADRLAKVQPEGWVLVPKEPTLAMFRAFSEWILEPGETLDDPYLAANMPDFARGYRDMVAAAPKPGERNE